MESVIAAIPSSALAVEGTTNGMPIKVLPNNRKESLRLISGFDERDLA